VQILDSIEYLFKKFFGDFFIIPTDRTYFFKEFYSLNMLHDYEDLSMGYNHLLDFYYVWMRYRLQEVKLSFCYLQPLLVDVPHYFHSKDLACISFSAHLNNS